MTSEELDTILNAVATAELTPHQAYERLKMLTYEELDFAKADTHRHLRQGLPEVIYCPGKTAEQIVSIAEKLRDHHALVIATRAQPELAEKIASITADANYDHAARAVLFGKLPPCDSSMTVCVVTAGTADIAVAEEACLLLTASSVKASRLYDVGVAGIHRLFSNLDSLRNSSVIIVVAGMDGALPSVIGGLTRQPVIAVPTSVGYGANFQGLSALLTMLNSCAPGLTVVNIDSGFGAAAAALRILRSNETANIERS